MADTSNASKAAFKLDLIETVNADPLLEPSDTKLIAAYAAVMQWPKREAWLSTSRARAMTGLSERQVTTSRLRLSGMGKKPFRVYLARQRKNGTTTVYRLENPWLEDGRQHVTVLTEFYREQQKERQAQRRQASRPVSAVVADTEGALSHSPSDCDVSAMSAGNIPSLNPSVFSSEEGIEPSGLIPTFGTLGFVRR